MIHPRYHPKRNLPSRSCSRWGGATGPLIGLLLHCAFLSVATDSFLSLRNFLNIMDQITVLGILAVGMTFVFLIGSIDLSVGSVLALAMMVPGHLSVEAGAHECGDHRGPAGSCANRSDRGGDNHCLQRASHHRHPGDDGYCTWSVEYDFRRITYHRISGMD